MKPTESEFESAKEAYNQAKRTFSAAQEKFIATYAAFRGLEVGDKVTWTPNGETWLEGYVTGFLVTEFDTDRVLKTGLSKGVIVTVSKKKGDEPDMRAGYFILELDKWMRLQE